MLRGLDEDDCGLVLRAQVGDETQWLFAAPAGTRAWEVAATSLLQHGFGVIDGFLGAKLALALHEQARRKYSEAGSDFEHINAQFARHGLCSTRLRELTNDDESLSFMPKLTKQCATLVQWMAQGSVAELAAVTHRSKPMLAVYPEGGRYMRHGKHPRTF